MTQANRVHSTPPTNTPIDTSRRSFLGGTAAALAAGTAVNVAALVATRPAAAASDPILAAIEAHRQAVAFHNAQITKTDEMEGLVAQDARGTDPRWIAWQKQSDDSFEKEGAAEEALVNTMPTTLAGACALLKYVNEIDDYGVMIFESNYEEGGKRASAYYWINRNIVAMLEAAGEA